MARTLAALHVTIGLRANGQAGYPNFNLLSAVQTSGKDWSKYIDTEGTGWHYDEVSGHRDDTVDSPIGQQFGLLLVPEQFVVEAVSQFPSVCARLTEVECEAFYDTKARINAPVNTVDEIALTSLSAEIEILKDLVADDAGDTRSAARLVAARVLAKKAIDPDDATPGVIKNLRKRWVDEKVRANIVFQEAP